MLHRHKNNIMHARNLGLLTPVAQPACARNDKGHFERLVDNETYMLIV